MQLKKLLSIAILLTAIDGSFAADLTNVSARVSLNPGATVTVGFVVAQQATYLVRAVGPTLARYGVTKPAGHPTLTLYRGQQAIAQSTNWVLGGLATLDTPAAWIAWQMGWQNMKDITSRVGAFPLESAATDTEVDSAFVVTLGAGTYTVACTNAGTAGDALVEVYAVPTP